MENIISIKKLIIALFAICMMGSFSVSFASNNTFTFTNTGITTTDTSGSGYKIEGTALTINEAGTYTITGTCEEGSIKVKKETTGVNLILKDIDLSCSTTAPISLNKSTSTTIEIQGTVSLKDKEDITTEDTNEDFEGACIKLKSGSTLSLKGNGTLNLDGSSCKNGIKGAETSKIIIDGSNKYNIKVANSGIACDGSMIINGGTFDITAEDAIKCDPDDDDLESLGDLTINGGTYTIKASSDGVRANGKLEINGGTYNITAGEGMEGTYVLINDGTISISSSDDGINASNKSSRYQVKVEINGGNIAINMGQGDTDAIDANGELIITGGTINITARNAFDYDSKVTYTGGDIIVNGEKVTTITNQMMGGRGNGGRMDKMPQDINWQNGQMPPDNFKGQMTSGDFKNFKQGRQKGNGQNDGQMPPMMPDDGMQNRSRWKNASSWAISELNKADEKQLIPDVLNGSDFTSNITRKEFAHIVIKLYEALTGKKMDEVKNNPFTDTNDSEVLKAYGLGITNGTTATTFSPNNLITREEMATMMTRALNKAGINTSNLDTSIKFDDDSEMHSWGRNAIYFMSNNNIIQGVGNNRFNVKGNATKEQSILLSVRAIEKFNH